MKNSILLFFFALTTICLFGQGKQLAFYSNWDDDTLPDHVFGTFNEVWGYERDGREYAIMGSAAYVHFFDITDPSNLVHLGDFAGGEQTVWRDMKTYDDKLYAVSDGTNEGLMIFDLTQLPDTLIKIYHSNEHFGSSHNIFIDESAGRLYTTNGQVLDIASNPDKPDLLRTIPGFSSHDLYVRDNIAYLSIGFSNLMIYDVSDVMNPILLGNLMTSGYNHSSWLTNDGQYAVYAEETEGLPLGVADLRNLESGEVEILTTFKEPLLGSDYPNNVAHNPIIKDDLVYVSYYEDGVVVFDISDPANPTRVTYYDTQPNNTSYNGFVGCWGVYPLFSSNTVLASDMDNGLYVLKLEDAVVSSTNSIDQVKLKVFPNPATDQLQVQLENPNQRANYRILNLNGQTLSEGPLEDAIIALPNSMTAGMYLLEVQTDSGVGVEKITVY